MSSVHPQPRRDTSDDLGDETLIGSAQVDRALLAYLNGADPAGKLASLELAGLSPEELAEVQEFLAADAELQQLMGALAPLASNMLAAEIPPEQLPLGNPERVPAALREESLTAPSGAALAEEEEPAEHDPALASGPSSAPTQAEPGVGLPTILAGGAIGLAALGLAVWLLWPRPELAIPIAGKTQPKARSGFVPKQDLWVPPVVTPGDWHYALGDDDPGAKPGEASPESILDRDKRQSLKRWGEPSYAGGLVAGSRLALALAPAEGYKGPILTTATDNFVLEAWFKPTSKTNAMVVNNGNGGANGFGLLLHDNGHPGRVTYMGLFGGIRFLDTNIDVRPGVDVHLAVVCAGQQTTVYLDGKAFPLGPVAPHAADGEFQIGQTVFEGTIDEVRLRVFPPGTFKPEMLGYKK